MPTYTPCPGSGKHATDARRMNTAGLGSKFTHLHGKVTAKCVECGKSVRVPSLHAPFAPTHKALPETEES